MCSGWSAGRFRSAQVEPLQAALGDAELHERRTVAAGQHGRERDPIEAAAVRVPPRAASASSRAPAFAGVRRSGMWTDAVSPGVQSGRLASLSFRQTATRKWHVPSAAVSPSQRRSPSVQVCVALTRPWTRAGELVGFTTSHIARQSDLVGPPPGTSGTMGAPERMFGFRTAKVRSKGRTGTAASRTPRASCSPRAT